MSSVLPTNDLYENPIGTDGFEFVEYASQNPETLQSLFKSLGFTEVARHQSQNITLYRQGEINFLINGDANSFARSFAENHGPCACSMGFRVKDAAFAFEEVVKRGAEPYTGPGKSFDVPAIQGIGGSLIYLIDAQENDEFYQELFTPITHTAPVGLGMTYIDHLTHNVRQGELDTWAGFYERLFNFREIRFFDIKGQKTGLLSRAMTSPCGRIRIPINEPTEKSSQIQEYIDEYKGEGIQHIALGATDICESVEALRENGIEFLTIPDTYYELLEKRLPNHGQDVPRIQKNRILLDGDTSEEGKPQLLQIFTDTVIGPIFFEIIERQGHQGFGEGNFGALFEAMELDQMKRGVL